jgi:FkbM family methyltransferase
VRAASTDLNMKSVSTRSVRKIIYYKGRLLLDTWRYFQRFDLPIAAKIYRSLLLAGGAVTVSLPDLAHPIRLRAGTSDVTVFRQVFLERCYAVALGSQPRLVIDGGANIGLASVFFANRFPQAHIIAVEPEASNFEMLKYNAAPYANIECIRAGMWSQNRRLGIKNPDSGKWAFEIEETTADVPDSFVAVTLGDLLERSGFDVIDLLKLDIEGSEREVFTSDYKRWLPHVQTLIIELHDDIREGCSAAVQAALENYSFKASRFGRCFLFEQVSASDEATALYTNVPV